MLSTRFHKFLRDESGGYTVWSLIWFSLYVAMGGLAVDVTDAYRNQTLLQATADASALAAVMSLPDQVDAIDQALAYAADNMDPAVNGNVLKDTEVILGDWSFATRTFSTGGASPHAARVITRRDDANNNPLATNFLRILGLWGLPVDRWNISVEAVATKYVPDCLRGGLISYNAVNVTSGNGFHNEICLHGQNQIFDNREQDYAVSMGTGNTLDPGVTVSMPDLGDMDGRPNIYESNIGLADAMLAGDLWPKDAMAIGDIMASLQALSTEYMPGYVLTTDGNIAEGTVIEVTDSTFPDVLVEYKIYKVNCSSPNKLIKLPSGVVIKNVVIITDCNIQASHAAAIENALIASSALGNGQDGTNQDTISLSSDASLGASEFCTNGGDGGVEIYALASVHIAAKLDVRGLRVVVGGDFSLTAQGDVEGISVQAMDRLEATAGGDFGLCPNGTPPPGQFAWHYRLVL